MERECGRCGAVAPLATGNRSKRTGERLYRSWCIQCEKARKDAWRAQNADMHNQKCRAWVANNPDARAAASRRWREANKDKQREAKRRWLARNTAAARAQTNARRRALRAARPKALTELDLLHIREIYHAAQLRGLTVDHEIPLQHALVCGLHVPWNLRLLPASANYRKSNAFGGLATRGAMK